MTVREFRCRLELLQICCRYFRPGSIAPFRFETLTDLCRWMPSWSARDITNAAEWLVDNNCIDGSACGYEIIQNDVMWELCIVGVNITPDKFEDKYADDLEDMWLS